MTNQQLGKLGEDAAKDFLEHNGYRILCRNFRCRSGEIDIAVSYTHLSRRLKEI